MLQADAHEVARGGLRIQPPVQYRPHSLLVPAQQRGAAVVGAQERLPVTLLLIRRCCRALEHPAEQTQRHADADKRPRVCISTQHRFMEQKKLTRFYKNALSTSSKGDEQRERPIECTT